MIRGQVDADKQAVLPLQIQASNGQVEDLDVVIDTGFSGYLTLPPARIAALKLPFQQIQTYTLGDSSEVEFDVYLATVLWDGRERTISVLATDGGALIGMRLIYGHRLLIDAIDGGEVLVENRSRPSSSL